MARLNVAVPDEVHLRFKVQCTLARRPMADVVVELVEEWTARQEKGKTSKGKSRKRG